MSVTAEQKQAKQRAYYVANREAILARVCARARDKSDEIRTYKQRWQVQNKTRIAAKKSAYHAERKDAISAYHKARYAADSTAAKARAKAYRDANPVKVKAVRNRCVKAWRLANPKKAAEICARRRARVVGTRSEPVDYTQILRDSGGLCGICRKALDLLGTEFDHIIPLARGGTHTTANIQVAHAYCNRAKGAKVA